MYSLLIADDELKERNGLSKLIRRFDFPLKIYLAENGANAFQIMQEEHIDILLTDIKMPFLSGIELIKKVREAGLNPICIIYSAYGEFEYAKEAISLGVIQYLLKPVNIKEFKKLLQWELKMGVWEEHGYFKLQKKLIKKFVHIIMNDL